MKRFNKNTKDLAVDPTPVRVEKPAADATVVSRSNAAAVVTAANERADGGRQPAREDKSLRAPCAKHYRNADGSRAAVIYPTPVHCDRCGKMEEVDNRLTADGQAIETRGNRFAVRFAGSAGDGDTVRLTLDKYEVRMSPADETGARRHAVRFDRGAKAVLGRRKGLRGQVETVPASPADAADVCYPSLLEHTDLEYVVASDRLKENIVVNAPGGPYAYAFTVSTENLTIEDRGDGSFALNDARTGETVFTIPAPYMYDAAGAVSDAVRLTLEKDSGRSVMTVTADAKWIEETGRRFPVVVDPQIKVKETAVIELKGGLRNSGSYGHSADDKVTLGKNGSDYDVELTLHAGEIRKNLGVDTRVLHAVVELTKASDRRAPDTAGFYVTTSNGHILDRFFYNGANNRIDIDVTGSLQRILSDPSADDLKLYIYRVNEDDATDYILLMTENAYVAEYRPRLLVDYVSDRLMTGDAAAITASVSSGGEGRIDLDTGRPVWVRPGLEAADNALQFAVDCVYNGACAGSENDTIGAGSENAAATDRYRMGKGMRLSVQQSLIEKKVGGLMGSSAKTYVDGLGSHHDFVEKYHYTKDGFAHYVSAGDCKRDDKGELVYETLGVVYPVTHEVTNELGQKLDINSDKLQCVLSDRPYSTHYYYMDGDYRLDVKQENGRLLVPNYYYEGENGAHIYCKRSECRYHNGVLCFSREEGNTLPTTTVYYPVTFEYFPQELLDHVTVKYYERHSKTISTKFSTTIVWNTWAATAWFEVKEERIYRDLAFSLDDLIDVSDVQREDDNIASVKAYIEELDIDLTAYRRQLKNYQDSFAAQQAINDANNAAQAKQKAWEAYTQALQERANKSQKALLEYKKQQLYVQNASVFDSATAGKTALYPYDGLKELPKFPALGAGGLVTQLIPAADTIINKTIKDLYVDAADLNSTVAALDKYRNRYSKKSDYQTALNKLSTAISNLSLKAEFDALEASKLDYAKKDDVDAARAYAEKLATAESTRQQQVAIDETSRTIETLEQKKSSYEAMLHTLQTQRDRLVESKLRQPIDFLTREDGSVMAFDSYGRLVAVFDRYENFLALTYEGDKLTAVADHTGRVVLRFAYEDERIASMTDAYGRTVRYTYTDGLLTAIASPDGDCTLGYDAANRLTAVTGQIGDRVTLSYDDLGRVISLTEQATAERVDFGGVTPLPSPQNGRALTISYLDRYTAAVTDAAGNRTVYTFDNRGRTVCVYEDASSDPAKRAVGRVAAFDYYGADRAFSSENACRTDRPNLVENGGFVTTAGWQCPASAATVTDAFTEGGSALRVAGPEFERRVTQTIAFDTAEKRAKLPANGRLLLTAWGRARSAVLGLRRMTAYGEDVFGNYNDDSSDDYKRGRRFGVAATVTHTDGTTETFEAAFDFYNEGWQLTALPVFAGDPNKVAAITVTLDYTNNVGPVYFDDVRLCACPQGTYRKFDYKHRVVFEDDGERAISYVYDGEHLKESSFEHKGKTYVTQYRFSPEGALLYRQDHTGLCGEFTYDERGVLVAEERYPVADPTDRTVTRYTYDERGELTDRTENSIVTRYLRRRGLTESVIRAGSTVSYGHDYDSQRLLSMSADDDGRPNDTTRGYTAGLLTRLSHNGFDYTYAYDGMGRKTETAVAGTVLKRTAYSRTDDGETETVTTATGDKLATTADNKGRVVRIASGADLEETLLENVYDGDRLTASTDALAGIDYAYTYDEDALTQKRYTAFGQTVSVDTRYDNDEPTEQSVTIGNESRQTAYAYDDTPDRKLTELTLPDGSRQTLAYDAQGRMTERTRKVGDSTLSVRYGYTKRDGINEGKLKSVTAGRNGVTESDTEFRYDEAGNLTEIVENGITTKRYTYDTLSRLVREDDRALDATTEYRYDGGGNILTRLKSKFTLETPDRASADRYAYPSDGWRDKLLEYNGEKCVYDAMGRPTTYRDMALEWSPYGTLTKFADVASYTYTAEGFRTSKTVAGKVSKFLLDGSKILKAIDGAREIWYTYGIDGVCGMTVKENGQTKDYLFDKNAQGDVTHIYTVENGALTLAAQYVYDAWGTHKVLTPDGAESTDAAFIGNVNPFRYRSYYYDEETGLYYLNARYYDPETGRFISSDTPEVLTATADYPNGLNLFAYCLNNPVMEVDPSGRLFLTLLVGFLIGAAIGAAMSAVTAAASGKSPKEIAGAALSGALIGGILGGASVLGGLIGVGTIAASVGTVTASVAGVAVASFGAGMASYAINQCVSGRPIDITTMFAYGGITLMQGLFSFGAGVVMGAGGAWNSLKPGNSWRATTQKFGFIGGTKQFISINWKQMLFRSYFKWTNVSVIGFIRTALSRSR